MVEAVPDEVTSPLLPDTPRASEVTTAPLQLGAQFVEEELPADFWEMASAPHQDDRPSATDLPRSTQPTQTPLDSLPLFAELQSLFPGRILKITPAEEDPGDSNGQATTLDDDPENTDEA